jgi:hypothetical protein
MQDPTTDDAPIPTDNVKKGPRTSGMMIRKVPMNTFPTTDNPSWFSQPSWLPLRRPLPEDEHPKVAKKPRLVTFAGTPHNSTAEIDSSSLGPADSTPRNSTAEIDSSSLRPADMEMPASHKGKWTAEEDAKLAAAAEKCGQDWVAVAAMVPGRTNQCRYKGFTSLCPTTRSKRRWTPEEDVKLIQAIEKLGKNWVSVAALVPGRTNVQCRSRWLASFDPATTICKKGKWMPEEDAKLAEAVVLDCSCCSGYRSNECAVPVQMGLHFGSSQDRDQA